MLHMEGQVASGLASSGPDVRGFGQINQHGCGASWGLCTFLYYGKHGKQGAWWHRGEAWNLVVNRGSMKPGGKEGRQNAGNPSS